VTVIKGSNGSSSITINGTLANLNAALNTLTYTPSAPFTGAATVCVLLNNSVNGLDGINGVNFDVLDPNGPSITAPASETLALNQSLAFTGTNTVSVTDPGASGTSDSVRIALTFGTVSLGTTNGLTFTNGSNNSNLMTVTGTLADLNAALSTLTYTAETSFAGSNPLYITVTNAVDNLTAVDIVPMIIAAPALNAPASESLNENGSFTFPAGSINVTDTGAIYYLDGFAYESVTLTAANGTLALGSTRGLLYSYGANNSSVISVTGTLANVNAALSGLVYTPNSGFAGSDALQISFKDEFDLLIASATVPLAVTVTGVVNPGTQNNAVGDTVSLQVQASGLASGDSWTYSATGLPSGLYITASTGVIAGTVTGSANTYSVTVTATDGTKTSASQSFTWNVSILSETNPGVHANAVGDVVSLQVQAGGLPAGDSWVFSAFGLPSGLSINASTGLITGTVTGSANNYSSFVRASDGAGAEITVGFEWLVNYRPAISAPATASVTENVALTFSSTNGNQINLSDASAGGGSDFLTISVSHGTVTLGGTTGLTFLGGANGSSSFVVEGTIGNLAAAVNGLTYQPTANYVGPDSLALYLVDQGDALSTSSSVAITVNASSAPTITAPSSATVSENGSLLFSSANGNALYFTDNGAGTNSDLLTMSVAHGTLTLGSTNGLIFTSGSNGSVSFTVKGTVTNLNAAIANVTYTPTANYAGSDTLAILVSDPSDGQSGSGSVAITVSPLPPSITAPLSASLTQNGSFVFSGNTISVTDANPGAVDSLSLSVTHGTLTLSTISGLTFPSGSNGTATFTVSGTVANLNAALSGLVYAPTTNYVGSDSLAMSISDPGDGLSASKNVSLTINSLPAPTIGAPASATMQQNSSLVFSSANGNAISVADSGAGTNSDSLTLSVAHGTLTLATTSGLTFTSGTNGSASFTVTGTISNLNAALSGLTYRPTAGYTGSDSLAISLNDTLDTLSASKNVALTVSGPPTITAPPTATVLVTSTLVFAPSKANGISIADVNAGTTVEPLTLTATDGTLLLGSTTGITFTSGANGGASMTIQGTLANLNAALNGLTFRPIALGSATVVLSYTDVGTGQLASATINITVQRLVFRPGQVIASSSPSSAVRASSVSGPNGGGTLASAVTSTTTNNADGENSPSPDALTQWQGLNAAVDVLNG
jgi:hypothetical protein